MEQELKDFIKANVKLTAVVSHYIAQKTGVAVEHDEIAEAIMSAYSEAINELEGKEVDPHDIVDTGQLCITAGGKAFGTEKVQKMIAGINEAIDDGQEKRFGELVFDVFGSIRDIKAVAKEAKENKKK